MKTLELDLKKKVLIVQPEETGNINYWVTLHSKDWDFICLGSELTEGKIKEFDLIETKKYGSKPYFCTLDYRNKGKNKNGFNPGYCSPNGKQFTNSFISAVESKGFYWLENHISRPINYELWAKYGDYTQYGIVLTEKCLKWQEAEEKTFRNPLIFIKNYVQ